MSRLTKYRYLMQLKRQLRSETQLTKEEREQYLQDISDHLDEATHGSQSMEAAIAVMGPLFSHYASWL